MLSHIVYLVYFFFFFFNDTATTEIYTLSLHDALPISRRPRTALAVRAHPGEQEPDQAPEGLEPTAVSAPGGDRKSTRLNSSHGYISYAVFCLKKKKQNSKIEYNIDVAAECRRRT